MHIWIHKPAGRYYGFAGRRYPPAPVPKTRSNRCRRCSERRQMVTSVHRFQSLAGNFAAGNASSAGPSNVGNTRRNATRSTASARNHSSNNSNENRHQGSSSLSAAQLTQLNNIPNNVTDASNNQLILSNATNTNAADRTCQLLGFIEFRRNLAYYQVRCVIWITLILVTIFVAIAKFYFTYREPGRELFGFYVMLTLLLLVCLYALYCNVQQKLRNSPNIHQDDGDRSEYSGRMQEDHIAALTSSASSVSESIIGRSTATVPTITVRQNPPPPPPYHIAILIPPPISSDEAPPPSYDKIMR